MSTEHEEAPWSRQAAPGPPDRAGPGGDGRSPRSERSVWPSTTSTDRRSPSPAVHDGGLHRERDAAGTRPLGVLVVLRPHADPRRLAHRRIRRAHHGRRIRMVGASACLWSICTGLTFLASGFGTLFGLRLGLGIGEAGAHPACTRGHPNICRHRTAFGYQLDGGLPQHVRIGRRPAEPRTGQQRPAPRSGHRRTGLLRPERPEPRRGGGCADDPRRRGRAPSVSSA